jgi:MFS family permease
MGGHKATWLSAIGLSVATGLPILCPNYGLLMPSLLVFGFFNGLIDGCMNSQAGHLQKRLGKPIMSSTHACWTVGNLMGAMLGGALIGVNVAPVFHFIVAWVLFLPALIWMRSNLLLVQEPKATGIPIAIPHGNLILLGLIALFSMLAEGAIADWSGVFLKEKLSASQAASTLGYVGFFSLMFLSRIFGDWTTVRFGVCRTAVIGLITAGIGLIISTFAGILALGVGGFAIAGLGVATVVPLAFGAAAESKNGHVSHSVTAVASLGYVGLFSGPALVGGIATTFSLTLAIQIVAFFLFIAAFLAVKAFR